MSKRYKIQRFLDFPDKGRVCQKSFERNLRGQKVVTKTRKLHCFREGRVIKVREKRKLLDDCRSSKVVKKAIKYTVFVKATNSKSLEVVNTGRKIQRFRDFRVTRMPTRIQNGAKRTPSERHINFARALDENLRCC